MVPLISGAFLHAGLLHLAFNLWPVVVRTAPRGFSALRFLGLYLVSRSRSRGASHSPDHADGGASGAVSALRRRARHRTPSLHVFAAHAFRSSSLTLFHVHVRNISIGATSAARRRDPRHGLSLASVAAAGTRLASAAVLCVAALIRSHRVLQVRGLTSSPPALDRPEGSC